MPKIPVNKTFSEDAEKRTRTLSLIMTRNCNLSCSYCFEKHNKQDGGMMDIELAKKEISYFMELDDWSNHLLIDLFGGEPLLAFSLIKEIFQWCQSQTWNKKYNFVIGTNGTLLNDEMKDWFSSNRQFITLGLSLDGTKTAHDLCRCNSYDLVYPHIDFFKKNWPLQPAKMTVCGDTIPYTADSVIELEEMGLNFTANLGFENFWGTPDKEEMLLNKYEEQLDRLVDYYVEHTDLYPVFPMLGHFPYYLGIPGFGKSEEKDCVRYCGAGHEMVVVDLDGKRYPCHRFIPWVSGKDAPKGLINRQKHWKPDECANCKIIHSCPTCAGFNWEVNNDTGIRSTYHCEAHKLEVLASAKIGAERINKLPMSYIKSLKDEDRGKLNQKIKALFEIIDNGI